ncbi:pitrilysin family protein [Lacinutrix sp. MedPE-SW]|uniref:M16 family metallopeptidase n=1 Tax=Lacinutrix sp. MedPE-SW TaxID=1860087 RepID=UPI00091569DF|nr:insulinase family protein [Lacinutrix sp. MedPE-SW]OIQ23028.1 MAG: peptidase M16 [Lacinutrix sp. MedPE-SW]
MNVSKFRKLVFTTLITTSIMLFSTVSKAQEKPTKTLQTSQKVPFNPEVKTGVLSNGLTYYIKNNGKPENKVELRLVINAGSILEDKDQLGLAHFMEHMNFNGTKNFKKNELVDYLQSIGVKFGAHLNAYTSFDETVYILPIPSEDPEKLEKGFQILEDWAHNALLTEEEIDNERGVVLEELRLGKGANERMMQRYLPKLMYGSQYAKRLPIGTQESIENFTYESLRRFYKDWYRPDLMSVMAVGDVDVATLEEKIKTHFGRIAPAKSPRKRDVFYVPNHDETFVAIESDKEASFSQVQVMFKDSNNAKVEETVEDYRKSMAKSLFSQMINTRLGELRNSENPPFVFGSSFYGGTWARTKNAYQSFAMTSETDQLKALKALLEENERVKRYGFQQGEFERAKKRMLASMEKSFKDKDKMESNRIIGEYIRHFLEGEVMPGITWEYNMYKNELPNITLEEVNSLIKNYLRDDNRVIVITGPEKEGLEKVTEAQVKTLLNGLKDADIKPYEDEAVASSLISKLPPKGSITNTVKDEKLGTTTLTLSNGATVTYKKTDFKNDEIMFEAFSFGGNSLYTDADYKATNFANGGLAEAGVNGFDKTQLSKMLSGKIVNVRPSIGTYSENFRGSSTPKDLEELFQLTHLYFTALNKDEKAYNSYINKQKAFIGNMLSNPQTFFSIEMGKFMYGKSPRYMGFPTPEAFDAADYDLAYKKYKERFADAGDFKFYFVGNIDEAKIKAFSEKYLASLPTNNSNEKYIVTDFRPLTGQHTKIVEKGTDEKSSVRITYHGPTTYNAKEAHALTSLGEILTIKLVEKLREEEGGVYGAGARGSISKMPYGWFNFNISFPCGPENVEKLKNAALAEVDKLIKNGPTEKDLAKVKEAQLLERKEQLKQNRFWMNLLKNADYQDKDAKRIFTFEDDVNNLTKEFLQTIAKKYLTNGYILGIHNPEKA